MRTRNTEREDLQNTESEHEEEVSVSEELSEEVDTTTDKESNTDESHLRDTSEITGFDKLTSFTAFMLGMFMNWGSFNVMGFMMGMNYRFFLDKNNVSQIYLDLQTIFQHLY